MLTLKKRLFIEEYKVCKNASKAAEMAGYSHKSRGDAGHRLLKDAEVARILAEWEAQEIAKIVPQTKEAATEQTFLRAHSVKHEPTRAKYWEHGLKLKGYLGDDSSRAADASMVFNIIAQELRLGLVAPPQTIASTNPPTAPPDPNHLTPNALSMNDLPHLKSVAKDLSEGGGGGVGTAPEGGQDISINPLPKSPQILNSGNETQKVVPVEPVAPAPPAAEAKPTHGRLGGINNFLLKAHREGKVLEINGKKYKVVEEAE